MGQIADVLLLVGMTLIFAGALRVLTKRPSAITTKPLNNTAEPIALFENVKPDTLVGRKRMPAWWSKSLPSS